MDNETSRTVLVHNMCENEQAMQVYLDEYADKMRSDGIQRFTNQFTAQRAFLTDIQ